MEQKLMSLIWANSPVTAAHLARIAADEIGWKRTTTYTVIARLCERGILERQGKLVRPLLSRAEAEDAALRGLLESVFESDAQRMRAAMERVLPKTDEGKDITE
ncbi:MAG: BlaI/MecI/CopY family transcriptional regulator [Clostridia bacterium]|nr:BlaI/MecI/CopY family transcriptional regulator [Clostridia bacterium]